MNEAEKFIKIGNEFSQARKWIEASNAYQCALGVDPENVLGWGNLGVMQEKLGQNEAGVLSLKRAVELAPEYALAHYNLGMLLVKMNKLIEAIEYLEKAASLSPDKVEYVFNSGVAMQKADRIVDEIKAFEKVSTLKPDHPEIYYRLWLAYRQIALWEKMEAIEKNLSGEDQTDPFINIVRSEDPKENLLIASQVSDKMKVLEKYATYRKRGKKIRLGYFSSDLRDHPVGQMISGMLPLHDRSKFEVVALNTGKDDKSETRKIIKKGVDRWIDLSTPLEMTDGEMAAKIYDQNIDILIEMTGHTKDKRIGVCAYRPAPVQVEWLGFPGTTGTDFIDYVIVDKIVVPPEEQKYFSEKLLYLPHCYQVNSPYTISTRRFSRADWGLPEKGFVFGSFNQQYKIEPVIWEVWMSILRRVPGSVLWLWSQQEECSNNLETEAKKRGIDPKRIIFAPMAPKEIHLKRLQLTDLALDTLIYGGHTTTSDYLWAGVPVITKKGSHFAGRVASSILTEVGLDKLITKNLREYEDLAVRLASSPENIKNIKSKISHQKLKTNLFNTKKFVRSLEELYEKIVK